MTKIRRFFLIILALAAILSPVGAAAQPDCIRLHIVADSDSMIDQAIKLGVRDAVRECTSLWLAGCDDSKEAWRILSDRQSELTEAAARCAALYGFDGPVCAELDVFPFPDRQYGGELYPAGEYRAVRITLGEGKGRNWWCVVYPSLCLPEEADTDAPVEFYSSILRWILRTWEAIRA